MIDWFAALLVGVSVLGGVWALILGAIGRRPSDLTVGMTALVAFLLVVQLVITLVAPLFDNQPTGSLLEFYLYLISAILLPVGAIFWALLDRSRWSTLILGVAMLSVAVMAYRMAQIWFVQGVA